jgi:hypothetical protein
MLAQKDVGVAEALEKDLEAAGLGGQRLFLLAKRPPVPERVVERLGREVDDVGVWDNVRPQLAVERVRGGLADVRKVRDEAARGSAKKKKS